jgi:hypothetical protein
MMIGCPGYLRFYRRVCLVRGMLYRDISVQPYSSPINPTRRLQTPSHEVLGP